MSRLRPTRTGLLVALVLVLLGTVPVLVPLLVTGSAADDGRLRAVASGGVPALPAPDAGPATGTAAPPPRAGTLAPTTASPTPTPAATTTPPGTSAPTTTATPAPPPPPAPETATPSPTPPPDPTVQVAAPDLVVVSVTWSPEQPAAGEAVTFSAVVRNAGTDPTPEQTHGIAFSVDGAKVSWSAAGTDPLAPGEERTYTADGGPAGSTWTAAPGEHAVQAYADDEGRIGESDEANNTATAAVAVAPALRTG